LDYKCRNFQQEVWSTPQVRCGGLLLPMISSCKGFLRRICEVWADGEAMDGGVEMTAWCA
jgi:hypothetical protein